MIEEFDWASVKDIIKGKVVNSHTTDHKSDFKRYLKPYIVIKVHEQGFACDSYKTSSEALDAASNENILKGYLYCVYNLDHREYVTNEVYNKQLEGRITNIIAYYQNSSKLVQS